MQPFAGTNPHYRAKEGEKKSEFRDSRDEGVQLISEDVNEATTLADCQETAYKSN